MSGAYICYIGAKFRDAETTKPIRMALGLAAANDGPVMLTGFLVLSRQSLAGYGFRLNHTIFDNGSTATSSSVSHVQKVGTVIAKTTNDPVSSSSVENKPYALDSRADEGSYHRCYAIRCAHETPPGTDDSISAAPRPAIACSTTLYGCRSQLSSTLAGDTYRAADKGRGADQLSSSKTKMERGRVVKKAEPYDTILSRSWKSSVTATLRWYARSESFQFSLQDDARQ
ncbi:uncharacterized protein V1513DRAFT_466780 [Lipomyces chichibuensis]|uniref:uncharacterized protein n=1 Tax=Lipomyces chichibuensis TaxID=1546026 RepID=UPI003343D43A